MSDSSVSYQCTYVTDNEQYMSSLICRTSDLIQRYSGTAANPVIPEEYDFAKQKPVLQILLSSAAAGTTEASLKQAVLNSSTKWYVNDTEISFDNSGLSTALLGFPAGTFKKIGANTVADYPFGGLQFLKNVVTPLGGVSGVVKCQLAFTDKGGNVIRRDHTYTLGVKEFSSEGYELEVYTDGSMVLDIDNGSVLCRARLWKGATKVYDSKTSTGGKTLRWYTYDGAAGDWAQVSTAAGSGFSLNASGELTVGVDAVPTFLNVMAAVFSDAAATDYRQADSTDIATVHDTTDSLVIQPNPTPADGTLRQSDTSVDGVLFQPKVFDTKKSVEVSGFKFQFVCMSPAGTILNGTSAQGMGYDSPNYGVVGTPDNTELLTSYKVPRSMFEALNAGPTVLIIAYKAA